MTDDELHTLARTEAEKLKAPDKKQLRFNDIVRVARSFYPSDPSGGVKELVAACDKENEAFYDKVSMWMSLEQRYGWMKQ